MATPEETEHPRTAILNPEEMKLLLEGLAADDAAKRRDAAGRIYAHGSELARHATQKWLGDPELSGCFVMSEGAFPETTVGVAVEPAKFAQIRHAHGTPRLADVPPDIDAEEFELHFSGGIKIDVLTARDRAAQGTIARFLNRNGEGIQQVELTVRNVDDTSALLQSRMRLKPVYLKARHGADGTLVNFFLVDLLGQTGEQKKLLLELVQVTNARA